MDDRVAHVCVQVTTLANKIDSEHKKANVVKLTGSVAGAAAGPVATGAGTVTVGLVLAPITAGLAIPISAAVAVVFGGVTGFGTAGGAVINNEVFSTPQQEESPGVA